MTYATVADMTARFGERELRELSDVVEPYAGVIVASVIDQALVDASAEIDGYVAARYVLPLDGTPVLLTRLACDLARRLLFRVNVPDAVEKAAVQARATLSQIARGLVVLDGVGTVAQPSSGVAIAGPERVFTSETLEGF